MARDHRRRKRGYEKKKKSRYGDKDDPDYDHEASKIRNMGVAPRREAGRDLSDSDDGLLPYHGERYRPSDFEKKEEDGKKSKGEREAGPSKPKKEKKAKKDK